VARIFITGGTGCIGAVTVYKLLAQYGLKYNPFLPAIPDEDLWTPEHFENFFFRLETSSSTAALP
jgi:nucleoside-diphosphate-sugar epimerase